MAYILKPKHDLEDSKDQETTLQFPLPFIEAYRRKQKKKISWDEYIHHLFAHSTLEHFESQPIGLNSELMNADPLGHSIYCWIERAGPVEGS